MSPTPQNNRRPGLEPRSVEPEILDSLPSSDPRAQRSRRDLQWVNAWMGHPRIWAKRLTVLRPPPVSIVEIGAGDGTLLLKLAERLRGWTPSSVLLVDARPAIASETLQRFGQLGWRVEVKQADVFEVLHAGPAADLILANLFLHHFDEPNLGRLLQRVAERASVFAACEPRRLKGPHWAGWLVALLGGSAVTRHDAVVSVRAGFCGRELSSAWPDQNGWELQEAPAGLFSQFFLARRL